MDGGYPVHAADGGRDVPGRPPQAAGSGDTRSRGQTSTATPAEPGGISLGTLGLSRVWVAVGLVNALHAAAFRHQGADGAAPTAGPIGIGERHVGWSP